jgi:ribosomal-protein-alanine acetyltransferase
VNWRVRRARESDVPAMMEMSRQNPSAAHWSPQQYETLFLEKRHEPSERYAWVIENENTTSRNAPSTQPANTDLLAFLIAHHIAPDWELENIVVSNDTRRNGLGTLLLNHLISKARESQAASIFLEVRESNRAARALYEKLGFENKGSRKNYYANPQENGVLYRLNLLVPNLDAP